MPPSLQEVGLAVKRLQWRHHRTANTRLTRIDLSVAQWDVLRHLHARPEASLHDLARLTFQTDQSMGALATRMAQRGLIERTGGPGRAVRHRLTALGDERRAAGSRLMDGVLHDSLGRLSAEELAQLHALLLAASGPTDGPADDPADEVADEVGAD